MGHHQTELKAREKRWVFIIDLKSLVVEQDLMWDWRLFQSLGAATEKAPVFDY